MQSNHYHGIYFKAIVALVLSCPVFWSCLFPSSLISLSRKQIPGEMFSLLEEHPQHTSTCFSHTDCRHLMHNNLVFIIVNRATI